MTPPQRAKAAVIDPEWVVNDRGSNLEIRPLTRATLATDSHNRISIKKVIQASPSSAISATQLGVVYNHAMQQYGYISGEISYIMKSNGDLASELTSLGYPAPTALLGGKIHVVNARSVQEFVKIMSLLQSRNDVETVEPTVTYGPDPSGSAALQTK